MTVEDAGDVKAREKKTKFLNFMLNVHLKAGIRCWKEKVFGFKGDPRLKLLLIMQRDKVRHDYYEPVK